MLRARLLGQFDIRLNDRPVEITSRPAQSLFAYLLINHDRHHRRERLAGLFWPDTSEGNARSEQYTRFLRSCSEISPVLIILDDLQWADPGSIQLLFHLGRRLARGRILILGTFRYDEVAAGRGGERHLLEPTVYEMRRLYGEIFLERTWLKLGLTYQSTFDFERA